MAAAAHDPAFAKKVGIPQRVAKEFNDADSAFVEPKKKARMEQKPNAPVKAKTTHSRPYKVPVPKAPRAY